MAMNDTHGRRDEDAPLPEGQSGKSSETPAEGSDGTPPPTKDSPQQADPAEVTP